MSEVRVCSVLVTALASVAVLLTSCGSSDPPSSSPPSTGGTSGSASATRAFAEGGEGVVQAAEALLATLDDEQKQSMLLDFNAGNAEACERCGLGIPFMYLNEEQVTAAKSVLRAALGSDAGIGYDQVEQILLAEDVLGAEAGDSSYSSANFYLAFLGTPATTGTWQLHFSGHHLAVNITYVDGAVAGATPFYIGVEPTSWTADNGTAYAPLNGMRDGMLALIGSLTEDQLAHALLSESYTEVLMGPGQDQFPQTKEGLAVSTLSPEQQALVLQAMAPWVSIVDEATAESVMSTYQSDLDGTFLSYGGTTELSRHGDYVRIDGPRMWIEFVCQEGAYFPEIHYHTVYRDHARDHGGALS